MGTAENIRRGMERPTLEAVQRTRRSQGPPFMLGGVAAKLLCIPFARGQTRQALERMVVMTKLETDIGQASEVDLDGIVELQAANQADRGGSLSGSLPRFRIAEMMREMPLVVARRSGRVVGFLMTGTRAMAADVPIVGAMFAAYPGAPNAYVYGPICVAAEERGKGLAQAMFSELRRLAPAREGILFIRRDNLASLRAHEKMGMREVASFLYGGSEFAVLSYLG